MSKLEIQCERVNLKVSDGSEMAAYTARPKSGGPYPSLIVCQEAFGVNAHIRDVTERFAAEGFVAVAPELFHRTGAGLEFGYDDFSQVVTHYQAVTTEGSAADLQAAYDWLASNNAGQPTASIGYCMGGRVAFLSSTVLPVACAISYYGGGIAPNQMGPGLLNRVQEVHAPLLMNWGGKDGHIGPDQVRSITDALDAAGKQYVNVVYSKADHGFFCDQRASYDAETATLAWALTRAFLAQHLKI